MSATNHTQNYDLSQFVGGDIPSWLGDYNGDMAKIDAAVAGVAQGAGDTSAAVTALTSRMNAAETDIDSAESNIATLQASQATQDAAIQQNTGNIATNANNITSLDGRVTALEQGGVDLDERLNSDGTSQGTPFYFDEQNGVFGFNTSSNRGADTFHPFKSTVNPSLADSGYIGPNASKTVTIDTTKSYVVSVDRKYSTLENETSLDVYKVVNGVVTKILTAGSGASNCTLSGSTLTLSNSTTGGFDYAVVLAD